jgi:hypothetical protein
MIFITHTNPFYELPNYRNTTRQPKWSLYNSFSGVCGETRSSNSCSEISKHPGSKFLEVSLANITILHMSDTYISNVSSDGRASPLVAATSENVSIRPNSPHTTQDHDDAPVSSVTSLRTDGHLFPDNNLSSDAITKQQMDTLHDQMKRFKATNLRHAEIKSRLLAKQAEPPFYPHHGLFFLGPQSVGEGMIGLNLKVRFDVFGIPVVTFAQDIGSVSRVAAAPPFYMDVPYMQFIREKYVKSVLCAEKGSAPTGDGSSVAALPSSDLMILQRQLRADIVSKKPAAVPYSYASPHFPHDHNDVKLQPADMFYRSRKQHKREWKQIEKDLKKRRTDKDEARR